MARKWIGNRSARVYLIHNSCCGIEFLLSAFIWVHLWFQMCLRARACKTAAGFYGYAAAAAKWYEVGRVSQEVAAQIAGVSRSEFLTLLSRLQVSPMQESAEEALARARLLLQP